MGDAFFEHMLIDNANLKIVMARKKIYTLQLLRVAVWSFQWGCCETADVTPVQRLEVKV